MPVTEIAILHGLSPNITPELQAALQQAVKSQEQWLRKQHPGVPADVETRGTWVFQQQEDPSVIMLSAAWDSVDAHMQWIWSAENLEAMGEISKHIVIKGDDKVVLFHLDADIFSKSPANVSTPLLSSPVISMGRMYASPGEKNALASKFEEVRGSLEEFAKPHEVRSGWRVDKEDDAKDELVVLSGWDAVEKHLAFAKSDVYSRYSEVKQFVEAVDLKHYRRIM